jgi:outer membrane protein OmpA-like peptidoglycan-associated protein
VLTENGKQSAKQLVKYLKYAKPRRVTLMGHTDHHGEGDYNCDLSKRRALVLKKYLVEAGIRAPITTLGKGENVPFNLYDPSVYTQEEIEQINRRAEFAIDRDVSREGACL